MTVGRFILTPVGSGGDVHPYIGIGRELQARGHEVFVLTAEHFRGAVEDAGLQFVPVLSEALYQEGAGHPDLWHPRRGIEVAFALARFTFEPLWSELSRLFTGRDTVVVAHALAIGARAFQLKHAPWSPTVHLAPSIFRSEFRQPVIPPNLDISRLPRFVKRAMWRVVDAAVVDPLLRPWLDDALAVRGLPPARRVMNDWIHSDALTLGLFPEWFADPQPDWPSQLKMTGFPLFDGRVDRALSAPVESFLERGPPPVAFTPGTANQAAADFFQTSVEAVEMAGLRAILLTGYPEQIPDDLPDSVIHASYESFGALLPRCSVIVHHGGVGTTSQGLKAGIPQIVRPLGFDQGDNGMHLRRLGTGEMIIPDDYQAAQVASALTRLTSDPVVREASRNCAQLIAGDSGILVAADLIEGCLDSGRETPPSGAS